MSRRNIRARDVIIILIGVLIIIRGQPFKLTPGLFTGEWTTYEDRQYGLEIQYPGNWQLYTAPIRGFSERRLNLVSDPLWPPSSDVPLGEITIDHVRRDDLDLDILVEWARDFDCLHYGDFCNSNTVPVLDTYVVANYRYPMRDYETTNTDGEVVQHRRVYIVRGTDGFIISLSALKENFPPLLSYFEEFLKRLRIAGTLEMQ